MTSASHTTSEPEVTIVTCAVATADLATSRGTTEGATFPTIREKSFKISSHKHVLLIKRLKKALKISLCCSKWTLRKYEQCKFLTIEEQGLSMIKKRGAIWNSIAL